MNQAKHYAVRLNAKTNEGNHRIFWTLLVLNGSLPLNHTAAAYEVYNAYIQTRNPNFKFHSELYDDLDKIDIKRAAYDVEDEFHFGYSGLEIKNGGLILSIVSVNEITAEEATSIRYYSDDHLNLTK